MNNPQKGLIIVLSSPSGGGKSSLARALLAKDPQLVLSISATTRKPRPGEIEGVHYFFKKRDEFLNMINKNELLEYAEIYGNLYGTPKDFVLKQIAEGKNIVFDIDFQGAYKLQNILKNLVVSIFIMPPTIEALRNRLEARGQDSNEEIDFRIKLAQSEMEHAKNYDHILVNDDFELTLQNLQQIVKTQRQKRGL
jgi:guanylate kinase